MRLTATQVRAAKTPGKLHDEHGLILKVSASGSKSWIWRGTVHGRRRDYGLGSATYVALAEARDTAFEYRRIARAGGDPTSLRPGSDLPTFKEAVEQVIEAHRGGWKNDRSETNWRRSLEQYAYPKIGNARIDTITTADIARILRPIWHDKRETARKIKTRLGVIMRHAVAEGWITTDPAGPALSAALPRHANAPAQHFASLPHEQVAKVLAKLDASTRVWRPTVACLRFVAATACRSGEARLAQWSEIDRAAEVWTIPASRTKTNQEHVVPLSKAALAALDETEMFADGSGQVFPSPTGRVLSDGTLSKFTRPEGFTPHGLRASFRSWCAETGVAHEVAETALAHSAGAVEKAYQRSDLLALRRTVMDDWSAHIS